MIVADLSVIWITTRAAGTAALLAASGSVILGLALAGRMPKKRGRLGDARILHQALGIATIVALAVHLGTLALDPWLKPSLADLTVPFAMDYRGIWTGLGIIAGYGFIVFALSGYLRRRIGKRWNVIHRFAGVAWAMAVAHTLGSGSDASEPWMLAVVTLCVAPVVVLATLRIVQAQRKRAVKSADATAAAAGEVGRAAANQPARAAQPHARTSGPSTRPSAEARAAALHARAAGAPTPRRQRGQSSVAPPPTRAPESAGSLWADNAPARPAR